MQAGCEGELRRDRVDLEAEFVVQHPHGVLAVRCEAAVVVATVPLEVEVGADARVVALDQAHARAVL